MSTRSGSETLRMVRTVARYTGMCALVPAGMAAVSVPVALVFGEGDAVRAFAYLLLASLATGAALFALGIRRILYSHYQIFWIVSASWLVISLLGSIPFSVLGHGAGPGDVEAVFAPFGNALFESVSGFTTTGLTMVAGHESGLSHSLQWWRSFSQWIGGIGIIVAVIVFIHSHRSSRMLVHVELGAVILHRSVHKTALVVWAIYAGYTAVTAVALAMTDMSAWQAVNYSMSALSTGGFGITDNSVGDFGTAARLVIMVAIVAGALSFAVHQQLVRGKPRGALADVQLRWFASMLLVLASALLIARVATGAEISLPDVLFQAVTSLATAGFSTADPSHWPTAMLMLMIAAMIIGGSEGSAAAGIKVSRVRSLLHALGNLLRRLREHPEQIAGTEEVEERIRTTNRILQAFLLAILWIATLVTGVFVMAFVVDAPLGRIIFEAASALGCVGLSVGIVGPELDGLSKGVLTAMMWLGRLEIIPILAIILAPFYRATAGRSGRR